LRASISWSPASPGSLLPYKRHGGNLATTDWPDASHRATHLVTIPTVPLIGYFRSARP